MEGDSKLPQAKNEDLEALTTSVSAVEGALDDNADEAKPEVGVDAGAEELTLEADIYTLMFLSPYMSASFALSVVVFLLQISILVLTLWDLLREPEPFNRLSIPINNPFPVIAAQFVSLLISVLMQGQTFVLLAHTVLPPDEARIRLGDHPRATKWKWILGNVHRLLVGLTSLVVSFIIIVQTDEVLDIFKDFAAIIFVTQLAHLAFFCAKYGFFGRSVQDSAIFTSSARSVVTTTKKWSSIRQLVGSGSAFLALFAMLGGWGYLVYKQENHTLLFESSCVRIDVQLGFDTYDLSDRMSKGINPFQGVTENPPAFLSYFYFNGIYSRKREKVNADRPAYVDSLYEDDPTRAGKFSYCESERVWIFTIGGFDDRVPRGGCGQWLLRSAPTDEFLLEDVDPEWTVWTGSARPVEIEMKCMDCTRSENNSGCNFNGECRPDGACSCKEKDGKKLWFGELCQARPPCEVVDAFVHGDSSDEYHQVAHYMPLKEKGSGKRVLVHQRPIYWNKRNVDSDPNQRQQFLLYTGTRWYQTTWVLKGLCPDNSCLSLQGLCPADPKKKAKCMQDDMANFFSNVFHPYWDGTRIENTEYISEETQSFTPVGLRWLTLEQENRAQGDFGIYGFTYEETLTAHCFQVDDSGLCGANGESVYDTRYESDEPFRQRCECSGGSSGYFCQFGSNHPYVENQMNSENESAKCNEFFCDYLQDQEMDFGVDCTQFCDGVRTRKECWNKGEACEIDPAQ